MQAPFDNIVQYLFHQPSLHSVTVDELENMAVQHPYFAAAHFLLLKKMQDTAHPKFTSQLHKTTIYFNNPLWLQFLLQPETVDNFNIAEKPPFFDTDNPIAQPEPAKEEYNNADSPETILQKDEPVAEEQTSETHHEDVYANTPEVLANDSEPVVAHEENHGIMDVITEVFSDPNPLYNMTPSEPVNTITEDVHKNNDASFEEIHHASEQEQPAITEQPVDEEINSIPQNETSAQSYEPLTAVNNDAGVQQETVHYEENFTEPINTISEDETAMQSSDPWMKLANNAIHEETVHHEENFTEPINTISHEEIIAEQPVPVNEQTNNNDIAYEQPATEESVTTPQEELPPQPDHVLMNEDDHSVHEENKELHYTEKIAEPAEPVFETNYPAEHSTETTEPVAEETTIQTQDENNISLADAGETTNEEAQAPEIIAEQTGETYINPAHDADATDYVAEDTPEQNYNGDTQSKKSEPNFIKTIIETPAAKNDLLFEPYHTVDYFASQGIKLSKMEADSKDRFGRQLKSFTEWLKTMKRLPQTSIDKILSESDELKVVADANHSIENKEVITVAMAEVFEKQGMNEKAAEIYRKLSLLNPTKSAYFAARIEALKH